MQDQGPDQMTEKRKRIRPKRLIRHPHHFLSVNEWNKREQERATQLAAQPTAHLGSFAHKPQENQPPLPLVDETTLDMDLPRSRISVNLADEMIDISQFHTHHLMELSGMLRAVKTQKVDQAPTQPMSGEWWPNGIQQTGPLPVNNLYGRAPFGQILPPPEVQATFPAEVIAPTSAKPKAKWRAFFDIPAVRVTLGLAIGIALLFLISRFVNFQETLHTLQTNLTTPRGIMFALACGLAFVTAYTIRGLRWRLFVNTVGKISPIKAIQLFWVGVFLNFILPVRGGEVAKSLMLKRISGIPISQSLPTVAMDKALDMLPVLLVISIVPILGVKMDIKIWLVLGSVGSILVGMLIFIALAAWKRNTAIGLMQMMTRLLPKPLRGKIEGFATGFVDALLAGASQPRVFIPAVLLTVLAVICDGLFAMFAFWTIGSSIPFGTALFGYTVYITFYILPTTPGEVGTNEFTGLLVFTGLLQQNPAQVNAMFFFSHPFTALIMCSLGLICLSALGLTISGAMRVQRDDTAKAGPPSGAGQASTVGQAARV